MPAPIYFHFLTLRSTTLQLFAAIQPFSHSLTAQRIPGIENEAGNKQFAGISKRQWLN